MSIVIKDLRAGYGNRTIIPCASTEIPTGKVTMLIGQNGCGKSTLLKTVARIIPPIKGRVELDDEDITSIPSKALAKKLAILPQTPIVPQGILVKELVAYGRFPYQKPLKGLTGEDLDIVDWAMEKTGVADLSDKRADELSGGQRQRVWIALALAQKTRFLLLDEPTTYLDMAHRLEILQLVRDLNTREGVTVAVVIHELNLAIKFADNLICMRDGQILFEGPPRKVITRENLKAVYDIDAVIQKNPDGRPFCLDYSLARE